MRRILIASSSLALLLLFAAILNSAGLIGGDTIGANIREVFSGFAGGGSTGLTSSGGAVHSWTESERGLIASLSIDRLPSLPPDPSNDFGDNSTPLLSAMRFSSTAA